MSGLLARQQLPVRRLLKTFNGRAVSPAQIARRAEAQGLPAGWADREAAGFVNDVDTVTFEIPLDRLAGAAGLHFAQEVWMLRPSTFAYITLREVAVVCLRWDTAGKVS